MLARGQRHAHAGVREHRLQRPRPGGRALDLCQRLATGIDDEDPAHAGQVGRTQEQVLDDVQAAGDQVVLAAQRDAAGRRRGLLHDACTRQRRLFPHHVEGQRGQRDQHRAGHQGHQLPAQATERVLHADRGLRRHDVALEPVARQRRVVALVVGGHRVGDLDGSEQFAALGIARHAQQRIGQGAAYR